MKIVTGLTELDYGPDYDKQYIAAGKYFVTCHTGYCGSDLHEFVELTKPMNVLEWDTAINQMAVANAESYGIYESNDLYEVEADDGDEYSHNIEGYAVNYDPKKHNGYSMTGVPKFEQW